MAIGHYNQFYVATNMKLVAVTIINGIVFRVDGLETQLKYNITHYRCFCSGLCKFVHLRNHVPIVFLPG